LEMSGFGITSADDPLYVEDFETIDQECTVAETLLDDKAAGDYLGRMAKKGIDPHRCMRVWIHTHPFATTSPSPSGSDKETFGKKLGEGDWAIMVIFGRGMCVTAKLRSKMKIPGGMTAEIILDVRYEVSTAIEDANKGKWAKEFNKNIHEPKPVPVSRKVEKAHRMGFGSQVGREVLNEDKGEEIGRHLLAVAGKNLPIERFHKEWRNNGNVHAPLSLYTIARVEGYSVNQIEIWGKSVFLHTPSTPTKVYFEHMLLRNAGKDEEDGILDDKDMKAMVGLIDNPLAQKNKRRGRKGARR